MKSTIFAAALTLATSFGLVLPAVACGPSNNGRPAVCPTNNPYPYSPYGSNPYPYASSVSPATGPVATSTAPTAHLTVLPSTSLADSTTSTACHTKRDERDHSRDFRYGKVGRIEENAEDRRDQNRRRH